MFWQFYWFFSDFDGENEEDECESVQSAFVFEKQEKIENQPTHYNPINEFWLVQPVFLVPSFVQTSFYDYVHYMKK